MLFDLPDPDTLYSALLARDECFDGQVFVCVSSTGVFCRLTCPARKPKQENCTFFPTIGECIEGGFRPCKRCHPLQAAALADPTIAVLLHELDTRPNIRWSEEHVIRLGYDPSTVRRSFKRQFGMNFLEMARQRRLREGFETLAVGGKVITAQHEASFESASAFRAAFARLLGQSPAELRSDKLLRATWIPPFALSILTIGDLGFGGMHFQLAFRQPCLKGDLNGLRFPFGPAVHQTVIRIPAPWEVGVCPLHPEIKCVVQEKI